MQLGDRKIRVVFFDAAGTLFEVRGSVGQIYSTELKHFGVDIPAIELERRFVAAFRRRSLCSPQSSGPEDRLEREKLWWFELVREVLGGWTTGEILRRYFEVVFERFRTETAWQLFPDTVNSLERLRTSGRRLGIISNFDSRLLDVLENIGIRHYFGQVTLSWQVGAAKPDARIFQAALAAANVPAPRAMHVGDSWRDDYLGARGAGLQAVLLDRLRMHRDREDGRCVQSLSELCEILLPETKTTDL
jgi:putative hydrolase of the HAD superfamily